VQLVGQLLHALGNVVADLLGRPLDAEFLSDFNRLFRLAAGIRLRWLAGILASQMPPCPNGARRDTSARTSLLVSNDLGQRQHFPLLFLGIRFPLLLLRLGLGHRRSPQTKKRPGTSPERSIHTSAIIHIFTWFCAKCQGRFSARFISRINATTANRL